MITVSLAYAREIHPCRSNSLDVLCDRYGISNEHRVLHGALLDAELLADVWLAMTRGQESLIMGFNNDAEEVGEIQVASKGDAQSLPVIRPDAQAIEAHAQYLQEIRSEERRVG